MGSQRFIHRRPQSLRRKDFKPGRSGTGQRGRNDHKARDFFRLKGYKQEARQRRTQGRLLTGFWLNLSEGSDRQKKKEEMRTGKRGYKGNVLVVFCTARLSGIRDGVVSIPDNDS